MAATVIAEVQREVCGPHLEIMKSLPFGRETPGQVGCDHLRSFSGSPPVQFQLTPALGVNITNVPFIPQVELRLAPSEGCILRGGLPAQCFQAFLCFDYVLATHENVQILGLPKAHVSVHSEGKKRTLQRHYRYACVIQGFENAGKQLKADNGLQSTGIAPFSQFARDWFWNGETGNALERGPAKRGSPMAVYEAQIVGPGYALNAGLMDHFLLPGSP